MIKYNDVKVGDVVYITKILRVSWKENKSFWIPEKITRVTDKSFFIKDLRCRKEDGLILGKSYSYAQMLGDKISFGQVTDQSEDLQKFKNKVRMISEIQQMLPAESDINYKYLHVEELHEMLMKFEEKVKLKE